MGSAHEQASRCEKCGWKDARGRSIGIYMPSKMHRIASQRLRQLLGPFLWYRM